eukprot:Nitzschia sp. Nitz4//scaffold3_size479765//243342//244368//NITZ4_000103-RA/size479765-augustus-gene-1.600-mRNA-1//-1//CDS//3329550767//1744//frame0
MFDMFGGFNQTKLKPQLKMAVHRFQMASNKKSALLKQSMREVALMLAEDPPKEEKARIKAEALIRDDSVIEAYDILSLNCELLSERLKLIAFSKDCPPDLVSCVSTIIYASPRVDIPELVMIRKQFRAKYGKQFEENALNNAGGVVNERVVTKLSIQPPAAFLVQTYLEQCCERHNVAWSPAVPLRARDMGEPMPAPVGTSVPIARGTNLGTIIATTGTTVVGDEELTVDGVDVTHLPPTAPSSSKKSDFDEPDIYIPAAPGASTSSSKPSAPSAPDTKGDDDKGDDIPPAAPSGGGGASSATYQDLAARFDNLKNL